MRSCTIIGAVRSRPEPLRLAACALSLALAACAAPRARHPAPVVSVPVSTPSAASAAPAAGESATKKPKPKAKPAAAAPAAAEPAKTVEGLQLAEVGYYMDVMQGRLQQLNSAGVAVVRRGTRIVATASARFDAGGGRLELDPASGRAFAAIAKVLAEYSQTHVTLRAHQAADAATARACELALQRYLIGAGVAPAQIEPADAGGGAEPAGVVTATLELDIAPLIRAG